MVLDQTALIGFFNHPTFRREEEKLELLSKIKVKNKSLQQSFVCEVYARHFTATCTL